GEKHLSRILAEWVTHYNQGRPHSSLGPGIPEPVEIFLPTQPHRRYCSTDTHKVAVRSILGGRRRNRVVSPANWCAVGEPGSPVTDLTGTEKLGECCQREVAR